MSSLFVHGALAPLDPLTGVVAGLPWLADGCASAGETVDVEVTSHPREQVSGVGGLAPATEARIVRTRTISVEYTLSDQGSDMHPVPARRGRAAALAVDFATMAADPRLLQAWIRDINGNAPLQNVLIGLYTFTKNPEQTAVSISTTLTIVVFADVSEGALIVDADLVAAGLP